MKRIILNTFMGSYDCRSRWGCCHPHPSQTRTCSFPASGFSRKSFARVGVEDAVRDSPVEKRTEVMMSPPSSSPVRLSVVVSWTGSRSPRSPPVFPGNGSHPVAPPFPRAGPGEPSSPRSAVLWRRYDFPPTHPRSLICFASGVRAILRSSCSPWRRSRMIGGPIRARAFGTAGRPFAGTLSLDAGGISELDPGFRTIG